MQFDPVLHESSIRFREADAILQHGISQEQDEQSVSRLNKGLIFVVLYGVVEYTITNCATRFISIIKGNQSLVLDYKEKLAAILLNSEFEAVMSCGSKERWNKKAKLVDKFFSSDLENVSDTVFPGDSMNIGMQQVKQLWEFFHIDGDPFPSNTAIYLDEIKDNRNALAHGRESAAEIGRRFSKQDIKKRVEFVEQFRNHVVQTFELHCDDRCYLRETG